MIWFLLALPACSIWLGILFVPWRPWLVRERLDPEADAGNFPPHDITVLIPARNEAAVLGETLRGLRRQGPGLRVVVIDDGSADETAAIARRGGAETIVSDSLPDGWAGKLWALEQGRRIATTPLVLLLDADIRLLPGMVAAMRGKLRDDRLQLVSVMAHLRMVTPWERLLMPAFVFFFKLLYPFSLANGPSRRIAAAAGGCVLMETAALEGIGGFEAFRNALIDDCTLALRVKRAGGRTWIGLTHGAQSIRAYGRLGEIWNMVARSAFTQLRYSTTLLFICTALMGAAFGLPLAVALLGTAYARIPALIALAAMVIAYLPTLRYYRRSPCWSLAMPLIGALFLAMTWTSALRYWSGEKSRWKGRVYQRS